MQEYFSGIEAPRHEGYVRHKLADVLTIVVCAVMCRMTELFLGKSSTKKYEIT